jgi:hypothetical protein
MYYRRFDLNRDSRLIIDHATPREPPVFGGVSLVMLSPGLPAAWIPARRVIL